ncbi:NucA/NucB deoxyribonuclease domain-containing protein [Paenibacillus sp. GCM10023250]|uniref:NucA/NucB deoxyribonuclease domain-containing protein n=1 Tax=Paenibacillus sp. GCM10023250 TaxID=3252648 RepID=UPI003623F1BE
MNSPLRYTDPTGHKQHMLNYGGGDEYYRPAVSQAGGGSGGSGAGARSLPQSASRGSAGTKIKINSGKINPNCVECKVSKSKYPEAAQHIEDAIKDGQPSILTINRGGAKSNRSESLKGQNKVSGKDLDEYPPAMFKEGGKGASVRPISPSDNRGAGSSMGHQLRQYPNGTKVRIAID